MRLAECYSAEIERQTLLGTMADEEIDAEILAHAVQRYKETNSRKLCHHSSKASAELCQNYCVVCCSNYYYYYKDNKPVNIVDLFIELIRWINFLLFRSDCCAILYNHSVFRLQIGVSLTFGAFYNQKIVISVLHQGTILYSQWPHDCRIFGYSTCFYLIFLSKMGRESGEQVIPT